MNTIKLTVFCSLIFLLSTKVSAQDIYFSQVNSAETYLSPSFAGSTGNFRIGTNCRMQWPGISTAYRSYAVSADTYLDKAKSGVGVSLLYDRAGSANLNTFVLNLLYSYRIRLTREWQLIPAAQYSFTQKKIDLNKLVFPDALVYGSTSSGHIFLTDAEAHGGDGAASILLHSRQMWFGASAEHLFKPSYSFMGNSVQLPIKYSFMGGINFTHTILSKADEPKIATLTYRFTTQNNFKQLDIGAYGYFYDNVFNFGAWYRGLPFFKSNDYSQQNIANCEAIVVMCGISLGQTYFGYSFDLPVSKLVSSSAGTHEFSIIYSINDKRFHCKNYSPILEFRKYNQNKPKKDKNYLDVF